jgi:hypothetical protein
MADHEVQQLMYDGTRLFCPIHPNWPIAEGESEVPSEGEETTFSMVCTAPVGPAPATCMRSAQWPSKDDMEDELAELEE